MRLASVFLGPKWGRFLSPDPIVDASSLLGSNLFAYCNNNPVLFSDPSGNAPSLKILTSLHNAVVRDAIKVLKKNGFKGCKTQWATYPAPKDGEPPKSNYPNGYMDIYHYERNYVWEVKRNNDRGKRTGREQLNKYTGSHRKEMNLLSPRRTKPVRGIEIRGTFATQEGIYDITYKWDGALILYDYKVNPLRGTIGGVVAVGEAVALGVLVVATGGAAAPVVALGLAAAA